MTATVDPSSTVPLLVFGDDGSPAADVAWLWMNNHRWPAWHIEVVTVGEPDHLETGGDAASALQDWRPPWGRSITHPADLASLRFLTAVGDPRVLLGDRRDARLIVAGPRGLGHLRGLWLGSTTEWLLHHPPAPLALIRSAAAVRSVTVCVDGSPHARTALDAFLGLPLSAETEVTVLAVHDGRAPAGSAVADAVAALEHAAITVRTLEVKGKPTEAILGHLEEHQPELVVLGTRGLTGLPRLRLGSTASAVARDARCSSILATSDTGDSNPGARDDA